MRLISLTQKAQELIDQGIAVRIVNRSLVPEEKRHLAERIYSGRLSEKAVDWFKEWERKFDMFPTVAPKGKPWKLSLPEGAWMVGNGDRVVTVLGKGMLPHKDDIDLDAWGWATKRIQEGKDAEERKKLYQAASPQEKMEFHGFYKTLTNEEKLRMPMKFASFDLNALLDGNPNPLDADMSEVDPNPTALDIIPGKEDAYDDLDPDPTALDIVPLPSGDSDDVGSNRTDLDIVPGTDDDFDEVGPDPTDLDL